MFKALTIVLVFAGFIAVCGSAQARITRETTYTSLQLWNTAIRFFRVDMGFPLLEKDKSAGYVLFEYTRSGHKHPGAFEVVPIVRDGRRYLKLQVSVTNMPSYIEVLLLDKLQRKLRQEYGDPPKARLVRPAGKKTKKGKTGDKNSDIGIVESAENDDEIEVTEEDLEASVEEE